MAPDRPLSPKEKPDDEWVDVRVAVDHLDGTVQIESLEADEGLHILWMDPDVAIERGLEVARAAFQELEAQLVAARTFLASIAGAQPQRTVSQSRWMVEQAREGLRRSGGHDFDAGAPDA